MLHVQPKSGDDSFGDFWRKERKTHSNDLGLTSDSHIEGALYERPFLGDAGGHRPPLQRIYHFEGVFH